MKKIIYIVLVMLFVLSVLNDLQRQHTINHKNNENQYSEILHIKVKPGDTILSVTKEMNQATILDTKQVINDFNQLNPGTNPDKILSNKLYYFPLYNKEEEAGTN